jgi:hypothetical protein
VSTLLSAEFLIFEHLVCRGIIKPPRVKVRVIRKMLLPLKSYLSNFYIQCTHPKTNKKTVVYTGTEKLERDGIVRTWHTGHAFAGHYSFCSIFFVNPSESISYWFLCLYVILILG